jgi:murein L,D-transpeptidase YafK
MSLEIMWTRILIPFFLVLILSATGFGKGTSRKKHSSSGIPRGAQADSVIVFKGKRQLLLLKNNDTLRVYRVALGSHPNGPKLRKGDKKTPEGRYVIDWRNERSRYYRSLHVSYPNDFDRKRADSLGVQPGGDIMIHGLMRGWGWLGKNHLVNDWTNGCIAVTNDEIKEIWRAVPNKTPIIIYP